MRRLLFRLAGHLKMTVGELESRMSSRELSEWIAFDRLSPLPDPWTIHGHLCALLWAISGQKKKAQPADFIPAARPPRRAQSGGEIEARLRTWSAACAARARA